MRPFGSILFGHFGDRFGRKRTMIATLLLTGISTTLIGILPTHADIGILATGLLILARLAQTLAIGGEWAAAATMMAEFNKGTGRKAFWQSLVSSGFMVGSLVASMMFMLVNLGGSDVFMDWAWRIPFLMSALLLIVGYYVRRQLVETPEFQQLQDNNSVETLPIRTVVRDYKRPIILGALAIWGAAAWVHFFIVGAFGYIASNGLATRPEITAANFEATWIVLASALFFGWLADKVSYRSLILFNSAATVLLAFPIMNLIGQGEVFLFVLALILVNSPAMSAGPNMFTQLFPANVRQTGAGVAYSLGLVLAGITPIMARSLIESSGLDAAAWLFIAIGIIGAVAVVLVRRYQEGTPYYRDQQSISTAPATAG